MVANLKSLVIPIGPAPTPDSSWLDGLVSNLGNAIDTAAQNKAFEKNVVPAITGTPAPQQQPGFLGRLFGGNSIPAPAAQQQMAATNPAPSSAAVKGFGVSASPDATALNSYLSDQSRRSTLPAGMRNNNPGNIKFVGQNVPGIVGPSQNTDEGDPQAVFATPEAGMTAMYSLLAKKYSSGKTTANSIIAGKGGWTPGNYQAAANVARYAGLSPDQDINFNDPTQAAKFMRGLMMQEHGNSSRLYPDSMITAAIGGSVRPSSQATGYAPLPQPTAAEQAIKQQMPQQIASLDPSAGLPMPGAAGQMQATSPAQQAPTTSASFDSATATPTPLNTAPGPTPANSGYVDPVVTTAYRKAPAAAGSAPVNPPPQAVSASPAVAAVPDAGPDMIAAAQPANRMNVSNDQIAAMVRNPYTRQVGLQLWQQVLTGKTAQPWSFVKLDDGTLARANASTGEVQSLGKFTSSKKEILSNGKGAFYDAGSGQWITPPEGAAGNEEKFFGTTVPYYDQNGTLHYRQLAKDGNGKDIDFGPGSTAAPNTRTIDTGTQLVTVGPGGQEVSRINKDVRGESLDKASGTAQAAAQTALPAVEGAANQILSSIDSLANDPYLPKMLGKSSYLPNVTTDSQRVQSKMDQITGQTFLQAYNTLRGAGQITEVEGQKATAAMGRLNTAQSEKDYRDALNDLRTVVQNAVQRARQQAGQSAAPQATAPTGNTTSSGVKWSIEQ